MKSHLVYFCNLSELKLAVPPEWSLFKMFSRTLTEACPLASSSKLYVDVTDNSGVRGAHTGISICIVPRAAPTICITLTVCVSSAACQAPLPVVTS